MKVIQTIQSIDLKSGGPTTCTIDLLDGISAIMNGVELLTFNDSSEIAGKGKSWLRLVDSDCVTPLMISSNFKTALCSKDYDIYHCNALWMYANHITCKIARKKGKSYVLSPHGMLYPTALKINRWKKWPMLKIWFNKDIMEATCIHATCHEEMEHVRRFGYKGPIAVIPNPVVIPPGVECKSSLSHRKAIGFLGRINPIKKIENLLYAVAKVAERGLVDFEVDIIGKGDEGYENFLREKSKQLGITDRINLLGFQVGEQKYKSLSEVRALFVPSEQENFGMIIPEALICGTPVYASLGTPWSELNVYQCGWWCDNSPQTIANVIEDVFDKTEEELLAMGMNGRQLIIYQYEQNKVAQMMVDLYRWILGEIDKPEFVNTL